MTTPGQMSKKLAKILKSLPSAPLKKIVLRDRQLSEAGLRSKGARGVNAVDVTERDLAHELIANLSFANIKDTAKTVRHWAKLPCQGSRVESARLHPDPKPQDFSPAGWQLQGLNAPALQTLSGSHKFSDGIAALFRSIADGHLAEGPVDHLAIELIGPIGSAVIEIGTPEYVESFSYYSNTEMTKEEFETKRDIVETRMVLNNIIREIASMLEPES